MERDTQQKENLDLEMQIEEGNEDNIQTCMDTTELDSLTEKVKLILILLHEVKNLSDLHNRQPEGEVSFRES